MPKGERTVIRVLRRSIQLSTHTQKNILAHAPCTTSVWARTCQLKPCCLLTRTSTRHVLPLCIKALTEINGSGHVLGGREVPEKAFVEMADGHVFENDEFLSTQDENTEDTSRNQEEF